MIRHKCELSLLIFILLLVTSGYSQKIIQSCGTPPMNEQQRKYTLDIIDKANSNIFSRNGTTFIPIRIHRVTRDDGTGGISMGDVNEGVANLNYYYSEANIEYYIAAVNIITSSDLYDFNSAEQADMISTHSINDAVNVYFVNEITTNNGGACGYAYYPSNNTITLTILMNNQCMSAPNGTFVHELGHFFDLAHTHDKTTNGNTDPLAENVPRAGVNANCDINGDMLCDTQADPNGSNDSDCNFVNDGNSTTDINGVTYAPDIDNIMSYYSDDCGGNFFTPDQYTRIKNGLTTRLTHSSYTLDAAPNIVANPSGLTAALDCNNDINLTWTDNANNETGYLIERSSDNGANWISVVGGGVNQDITTFVDTSTSSGSSYKYRIKASNDSGNDYSNETTNLTTNLNTDTLQAHYNFNGNLNDDSSYSRSLSAVGGFTPTYVDNHNATANNAYQSPGIGSNYLLNTCYKGVEANGERTVAAWIKTTTAGDRKTIVSWGTNSSGKMFNVMVDDGNIRVEAGNSNVQNDDSSVAKLNGNTWRHIAVTYNPTDGNKLSDIKMYIDGVYYANQPDSGDSYNSEGRIINTDASTNNVQIGNASYSSRYYWLGELDDIRIYSKSLSGQEIENLFKNPTMTITASEVISGESSNDGSLALIFTSNEATDNFAEEDITVDGGSLSNFATTSSTEYTATFAPTADGATTIDVGGSTFTDTSGNNNTAATQFTWTYDGTAPVLEEVTAISSSSSNTTPSYVFTTDEAGIITTNITEGFSTNSSAASGSNQTVTFNTLSDGTYEGKTISVTDAAGNISSLTIPTFIIDTTAPTITITAAEVNNGDSSNDGSLALTFTSSEDTSNFIKSDIYVTGGSLGSLIASSSSTYLIIFTPSGDGEKTIGLAAASFTDEVGNNNTVASQFRWVYDTTGPTMTITASGASSGETSNNSSLALTFTSNEATDNFAEENITVDGGLLSNFASTSSTEYTATFTPTADGATTIDVGGSVFTDESGNNNTAAPQFTWIYDSTPPVFNITPADASVECSQVPSYPSVSASDSTDGIVSVSFQEIQDNGNCVNNYQINRTWTATDNSGNASIHTQVITVDDTTAPEFNINPADYTAECSDDLTPPVVTASDNCTEDIYIYFESVTTYNCVNDYTLNRTWTAYDDCGNSASVTQTVTVEDTTNPVLTVPSDITIFCNNIYFPANASATDNCGEVSITSSEDEVVNTPGSSCGKTITRSFSATDDCGNTSTGTQVITIVEDNLPPVVSSGSIGTNLLSGGEANQTVYTTIASDNNYVDYYSLGGTDASFLTITPSGVVSLTVGPDYESKNSYSFNVIITDYDGNFTTQPVTFSIINYFVITSSIPSPNSNVVPLDASITINFDADTNASTINSNTITVTGNSSGIIPGTFSGEGTSSVVFSPSSAFFAGEVITITLTTGIQSSLGATLENPESFSFTTKSSLESFSPAWNDKVISQFQFSNDGGTKSIYAADVDGDGDMDLVSTNQFNMTYEGSLSFNSRITWHENDGKPNPTFTDRIISTGHIDFAHPTRVFSADMDGDGDMDVIASYANGSSISYIRWFKNPSNNTDTSEWEYVIIEEPKGRSYQVQSGVESIFAADVDNDGDMDLVAGSHASYIKWYENQNSDGSSWRRRNILGGNSTVFGMHVVAADINNDGAIDILASNGSKIIWYENNQTSPLTWSDYNVIADFTSSYQGTHVLYAADMDNDGDIDVLSGSYHDDKIEWHENIQGDGSAWNTVNIETGMVDTPQAVFASDLDNDGDMDAMSVSRYGDIIAWHENTQGDGSSWSSENIVENIDTPMVVYSADMDGDGDMDIIGSGTQDNKISWYENYTTTNWTGSQSSTWSDSNNWSNGVPNTNSDVTISSDITNYPTASIAESVKSVTMASGSSLIAQSTFSGEITYNRNLATNNWYLISSPILGETYDNEYVSINELALNGLNNAIAKYQTSDNSWNYMQNGENHSFNSGIGYSVRRASGGGEISFTGTLNVNNTSISLATSGKGYNLVGNPYPSYIDGNSVLSSNTESLLTQTLWVWNQTDYKPKNLASNFILSPGQGFFVQSDGDAGNLSITESNQSHQSNDTFQRITARPELNIQISNGTATKSSDIFYINGTTEGFDNGYDSSIFEKDSKEFAIYTRAVANGNGRNLGIQSLPDNNFENMIIPLGVHAVSGSSLEFSALSENLPTGTHVYLEDKNSNTFTRIDNGTYSITTSSELSGVGRFYIYTVASVLGLSNNIIDDISVYLSNNKTLHIEGIHQGQARIRIYSILGKQLINTTITGKGNNSIALPRLQTAVYLVEVQNAQGTVTKKIFIE